MGDWDTSDWLDLAGKVAAGVGVTALAAAGVLAAKSGILQSAVSRLRRNGNDRLVDAPPAGTPLLVSLAGVAEHSGVFLGRSRVAELYGDGCLQCASLDDFLNGPPGDSANLRQGTRIFAACDAASGRPLASDSLVRTARQLVENVRRVPYNLFCNNCHMFTASCVCGYPIEKLSVLDWLRDGTFSVDRLGRFISNRLNKGREIAWLGVRAPAPDFRYALTEEKLARLRREGRL